MVESQAVYEKVPVSTGDIWQEYDPITTEGEILGQGMCSTVTKARKKSEGPTGQEYFIKTIAADGMMWSADNERTGLELAGNLPGVVKCYKIYDRRHVQDGEKSCIFVLKYEESGYLESWLTENNKDGTYLSKEQFFSWATEMSKTLTILHETTYMMHGDLHFKNWLFSKDGSIVLCDFGCSKVLGPGGKVPVGTPVFYADI